MYWIVCTPDFYMEILIPSAMVFGDGVFGRELGGALIIELMFY